MFRTTLVGLLLLGVGLLGCTYRPAVKPLSPEFEKQAQSVRFPKLFQNWLAENKEVQSRVTYYPHNHWKSNSGADLVYDIPYKGVAETVEMEIVKLITLYCQANGFGEVRPVVFPTNSDDGVKGRGCNAAEDKIAAGYVIQASSYYDRLPYSLWIYGASPTHEAVARKRKAEREAAEFRREQERKQLQRETERLRSAPKLHELVQVNLVEGWRIKNLPGYELMHPSVAEAGAIFTGRIREIRPPMVRVETGYFSNGGAVWVPMGVLEAPRQ